MPPKAGSKKAASTPTSAEKFAAEYKAYRDMDPQDHEGMKAVLSAASYEGIGRWAIFAIVDGFGGQA